MNEGREVLDELRACFVAAALARLLDEHEKARCEAVTPTGLKSSSNNTFEHAQAGEHDAETAATPTDAPI